LIINVHPQVFGIHNMGRDFQTQHGVLEINTAVSVIIPGDVGDAFAIFGEGHQVVHGGD